MHCRSCISKSDPLDSESRENIAIRSLVTPLELEENDNCLTDDDSRPSNEPDSPDMIIATGTGRMEEKITSGCGDPSIGIVGGVKTNPWYSELITGGVYVGDRHSLEEWKSDEPKTLRAAAVETSSPEIAFHDLKDSPDTDLDLNPGGDSFFSGLRKWFPSNPHESPKTSSQDSQLSKPSWRRNFKLQVVAKYILYFVAFVFSIFLAIDCFNRRYNIEHLESQIKALENKFDKLSERIEVDSSRMAEREALMEEKTEKQIRLALNTIHGTQCQAVAYNCAWNLVTTTPAALFRKMTLLD